MAWVARVGVVLGISTVLCLAWSYENGLGSCRKRAEREHGITLPSSAQEIQCRGDAWGGFLDSGARALFVMDHTELDDFYSGLQIEDRVFLDRAEIAGDDAYLTQPRKAGFDTSWHDEATLLEKLICYSPRGDSLDVVLWRLADDRVAVHLHTDWN